MHFQATKVVAAMMAALLLVCAAPHRSNPQPGTSKRLGVPLPPAMDGTRGEIVNLALTDWMIVLVMLAGLVVMVFFSNRYTKSVADFLVAGRTTGRYMMTMASGMVWIGALNIIAMFELYYSAGFTAMWWGMLATPFAIYMGITGFGVCRFRDTRALTVAQFLETRYSRNVRVFAGIIAWIAGMINFGIFPQVGARFFIHFCGLPAEFNMLGMECNTMPWVMAILLIVSLFFVFAGGQIAVVVTDCLQGIFTQVAAIIITIVIVWKVFDWNKVTEYLLTLPPETSMLNPLTSSHSEFSPWFFMIGIIGMWYMCMSNLQSQSYIGSAKTAHELKLAGILNQWRWLALCLFFMVITFTAIMILKHPSYAETAAVVNQKLDTIEANSNIAVRNQLTVTVALAQVMPVGMFGLFVAIMVAALISTYDSFMHSWGSVFLQDVVMPFRKKPFEPKQHIWLLRFSIVGIGAVAWLFSYFYEPKQSILMYFALVNNLWLGGAGAVILGGLYWKRGTKQGAMVALILSTIIGTVTMICHQFWQAWFERDFPINGQWVWFFTILICTSAYVLVSLLRKENFNMDKMLHRGKYKVAEDHEGEERHKVSLLQKLFGISEEFARGDRLTAYLIVGWFLLFMVVCIVGTVYGLISGISQESWAKFWGVYLLVLFVLAIVVTIWMTLGGLSDMKNMFSALKTQTKDDSDDGFVKHNPEDDVMN